MSGYSQFIYGKFYNWNSGYCLVACTTDLEPHQKQLQNMAEKELRFWGAQPPEGDRKAFGISEIKQPVGAFIPKNHLVLIQTEEADRASGGAPYTQQRYIFVPKTDVVNEPHLLGRLHSLKIPVFSEAFEPNLEYFELSHLKISKPENWKNEKTQEIVNSLSDRRDSEDPLLLLAIAVLLENRKLVLTFDFGSEPTNRPQRFLENIFLLLPAACPYSIAVALGAIDEARCVWADIIIKANGFPVAQKLPENAVWLNRKSRKFLPQISSEILKHRYVQDFLTQIDYDFDSIQRLQHHLQTLTDDEFTLDNLSKPDTLVRIIPGLTPGQAQVKCWTKYLPVLSNSQTIFDKDIDQPSLLSLWEALENCYEKNPEWAKTMPSVIQRLTPDHVIEVLNRLFNHPRLAENLISQGLFNILKLDDPNVFLVLRRLCVELVEHKSKIQQFNEAEDLASGLTTSKQNIFSSSDEKFSILDAILCADEIPECYLKNWFSRFGYLLANVNREMIYNSNFFKKHLDQYFSREVKERLRLLLENPNENLIHLPYLVDAMNMDPTNGADYLYHSFLNNLSEPAYINSLPLLHELISRSIVRNPGISLRIAIFPKTFSWFKQLEKICAPLTQLEQKSADWTVWFDFANTFYENRLEILQYLDRRAQIFADFPVEMLQQWMLLIDDDQRVEEVFLKSNTYLELKSENILIFIENHEKWEHVTRLAIYFIKSGRLQRVSGSLLKRICQSWLNCQDIPLQESTLWNSLISTESTALQSGDYLQLIHVKWRLRKEAVLVLNQITLTAADKKSAWEYASALISRFRDFNQGWSLIQDCYCLKLDRIDLKRLVTKLITEVSPTDQDIIRLLTQAKDWGLGSQERGEIIAKVAMTCSSNPLLSYYVQLTAVKPLLPEF